MGTDKMQDPFITETQRHLEKGRISLCLCVPVVNLGSVGCDPAREVN